MHAHSSPTPPPELHPDAPNHPAEAEIVRLQAALDEARAEAERARAIRHRMLANVSHELRTPLQAVLGFAEIGLSQLRQGDPSGLADCLYRISNSGRQLHNMIESLLRLAHTPDGDTTRSDSHARYLPCWLDDLLRGCLATLASAAAARQQHIEVMSILDNPQLIGDPGSLSELLHHLIDNALRYSPDGATILIQLSEKSIGGQAGIALRVIDPGCGIPEGEQTAIFEPFYQSSRTANGAGGSGLGLPLSRAIVRRHGGSLMAYNNPEGGACFAVWLPRQAGPQHG